MQIGIHGKTWYNVFNIIKEVIDVEETQMIEGILKEFAGLAKHPRKSGHEKEVSDYIVSRLRELGAESIVQDDVHNVIADLKHTAWIETAADGLRNEA